MSIKITFEWIPKCGHTEFDCTCMWCADLHRVVREAMKSLAGSSTKPTIIAYVDTDKVLERERSPLPIVKR